jgi:hypothetical protein
MRSLGPVVASTLLCSCLVQLVQGYLRTDTNEDCKATDDRSYVGKLITHGAELRWDVATFNVQLDG